MERVHITPSSPLDFSSASLVGTFSDDLYVRDSSASILSPYPCRGDAQQPATVAKFIGEVRPLEVTQHACACSCLLLSFYHLFSSFCLQLQLNTNQTSTANERPVLVTIDQGEATGKDVSETTPASAVQVQVEVSRKYSISSLSLSLFPSLSLSLSLSRSFPPFSFSLHIHYILHTLFFSGSHGFSLVSNSDHDQRWTAQASALASLLHR